MFVLGKGLLSEPLLDSIEEDEFGNHGFERKREKRECISMLVCV